MTWLMCCDFELAIAGTSINWDFYARPSVLSVVLVIGMVSILSILSVVLSISILGLPELPFGSGLIWVLACLFAFEATSRRRFVYNVRIDLIFKFLELGGQGVAWVTDLHRLIAGVGTASKKKKVSSHAT